MKHKYNRVISILATGLFMLAAGCNTINPKEQVPTYIHVDSFHFEFNSLVGNGQVATSHDINTVWAYYNNSPIGVFDLPATFPVMTNGDSATGELTLAPGVPINGFNDLLSGYPFYTLDNWTFKAQPGKVLTHNPKTSFYNSSKISNVATFDNSFKVEMQVLGGISGLVPIVPAYDDSLRFWGNGVGSITLNSVIDSSVDSTIQEFSIAAGQNSQILELDYKGDLVLYIGIKPYIGGITQNTWYLASTKPTAVWKKIYVALQDYVAQQQATSYKFYIKAVLPSGQTRGRELLDNIQIVTF